MKSPQCHCLVSKKNKFPLNLTGTETATSAIHWSDPNPDDPIFDRIGWQIERISSSTRGFSFFFLWLVCLFSLGVALFLVEFQVKVFFLFVPFIHSFHPFSLLFHFVSFILFVSLSLFLFRLFCFFYFLLFSFRFTFTFFFTSSFTLLLFPSTLFYFH